ncbi:lactoylglutathione lyase [Spirochaetia bacterium]|nr:lactoylglutathione lyase [Spirochaetia bacterium]
MDKFPTNHIVKIGIVVRDIEKAVQYYAKLFNIPAPEIHHPRDRKPEPETGNKPGSVFRGKTEVGQIITAVVKLEPIYIELIQPLGGPSPWEEFIQQHGEGVHYMAFEAPSGFSDVENFMAQNGVPIYHKTEKGTQRYGYFETHDKLGITMEFKEID